MDIDLTNQRILALLDTQARMSVTEIARRVNLSRQAVQERISALEAGGIILGYHAEIAPVTGLVRAIIFVQIASRPCRVALEWMQSLEGVTSVFSLSGDVDALVHVSMPNMEALSKLNDSLAASPLIASAKSRIVLRSM